jgi:hypothetical protein
MAAFASRIGGAFNPQKGWLEVDVSGSDKIAELQDFKSINDVGFAGHVSQILKPFVSLIFTILSLVIMIITLGALGLMLIIRYIFIALLLVLLPLAWASWVLPTFSGHWTKWWNKFLQYAFFPPVVLFFLWLGLVTAQEMGTDTATMFNTDFFKSPNNDVWGQIVNFFGQIFIPIIQQILNTLVLAGVMLGGLIAAQAMSIKFADAGVKGAYGAGKAFGNYVVRRGAGAAARFATKEGGAPPKPRTGRFAKPLTYFDKARAAVGGFGQKVRKVTVTSETSERLGIAQKIRDYGKKTDFGQPRRLWAEAKARQKEKERNNALGREQLDLAGEARKRAAPLLEGAKAAHQKSEEAMERAAAETKAHDQEKGKMEAEAQRLEEAAKNTNDPQAQQKAQEARAKINEADLKYDELMRQRGAEADAHRQEGYRLDAEAKKITDKADEFAAEAKKYLETASEAEKKEIEMKEAAWKHAEKNPGLAGGMIAGTLKGAGVWKIKADLKLDSKQKEELRKALKAAGLPETSIDDIAGKEPAHGTAHAAPPPPKPSGPGGGGGSSPGGGAPHH